MNKIDFTKPLQVNLNGIWVDIDAEGRVNNLNTPAYVRNKPEPRFVWLNVYRHSFGYISSTHSYTEESAREYRGRIGTYIHTLKINLDTGETEKVYLS